MVNDILFPKPSSIYSFRTFLKKRPKTVVSLCLLTALIFYCVYYAITSYVPQVEDKYDFEWILKPVNYAATIFSNDRTWVQRWKKGSWALYDGDGYARKDGFSAMNIFPYSEGYALFWQEVPRDIVIKSFDDNLFHIAPKRKTRNYDEIVKNIMQARRDPFSHYNAKDYVIDDYGTKQSGFFKLTPKSAGFTSR